MTALKYAEAGASDMHYKKHREDEKQFDRNSNKSTYLSVCVHESVCVCVCVCVCACVCVREREHLEAWTNYDVTLKHN